MQSHIVIPGFTGSKHATGAWQRIVSMLPAHRVFIEAFAGGAAVTMRKKPASETRLFDIDESTAAKLSAAVRDRGLTSIKVTHGDAIQELSLSMLATDVCVYCDPPYVMSSRRSPRKYYRHEWDDADHVRFLEWVRSASCPVLISGYYSELYASSLQGWRSVSFGVPTRRGRAIEWVWCNFDETLPLHDVRYVGDGFTDRQRIKRKAKRWAAMLAAMPPGERAVVVAELSETMADLAQLPTTIGAGGVKP